MSLLRLARQSGRYMVLQYFGIRRSPSQYKQWEVRCLILDLCRDEAEPELIWCPVSDMGHYPPLAQVGRRPGRLARTSKPLRRTFRGLKLVALTEQVNERSWSFEIDLFQTRETRKLSWLQVTPDVLLEDRAGNRVAIPTFELGRFYCGLLPDLLDTIFESGMTPEGSMELLFNPEKTEIVGRRFEVAPRRSFCSVSAILQIAMAVTDREIVFHFQRGLAQMKEQLRINDAWPFLVVPILPMDLTLEGRSFPFLDPVTGAPVKVFAAMRVVSDHRDRSVDEIVVQYPFALFPRRLESRPEDENLDQADDRFPVIFGPDTQIGRRLMPGKKTVFVPSLYSRFTTSAPRWRKTPITYAYREPSVPPGEALPPRTRTSRDALEAAEASISQATSQGAVPQARNRTMRERRYADKLEERDRVASEFLKGLPAETLTSERIEASSSPKAFRVFLEAGVELFEWQDTRLSPNIAGEVGEGTALVLPESWGGIAGSTKARAPRRIIALPLLIGSVFVWTVEIERRAHYEKMSVGLFASQRGDVDPLDLLNSVMYNICRRTARKQDRDHLGLWPNADYLDVRLMSLTHAPLRRYPCPSSEHLAQVAA